MLSSILYWCSFVWILLITFSFLFVDQRNASPTFSLLSVASTVNTTSMTSTVSFSASHHSQTNHTGSTQSNIDQHEDSKEDRHGLLKLPFHHMNTVLYLGYLGSAYLQHWESDEEDHAQHAQHPRDPFLSLFVPQEGHQNSRLTRESTTRTRNHTGNNGDAPSLPSPEVLLSLTQRYSVLSRHGLRRFKGRKASSSVYCTDKRFEKGTEERMWGTTRINRTEECDARPHGCAWLAEEEEKEWPPLFAAFTEAATRWGLHHVQLSSCGGQWHHPVWSTPASTRRTEINFPIDDFTRDGKGLDSSCRLTMRCAMPSFDEVVHSLANHAECTLPSVSVCGQRHWTGFSSTFPSPRRFQEGEERKPLDPRASTTTPARRMDPKRDEFRPFVQKDAMQAMSFFIHAFLGVSADTLFPTGPSIRFSGESSIVMKEHLSTGLPGQQPLWWQPLHAFFSHTTPAILGGSSPPSGTEAVKEGDSSSTSRAKPFSERWEKKRRTLDTSTTPTTTWCTYEEVPSGGPLCSSLLSRLLGVDDEEDEEDENSFSFSSSNAYSSLWWGNISRLLSAEKKLLSPFRALFGPWNNAALLQQPYYELSIRFERREKNVEGSASPVPHFQDCGYQRGSCEDCPPEDLLALEIRLSTVVNSGELEEEEPASTPGGSHRRDRSYPQGTSWVQHWKSEKVQTLLRALTIGSHTEDENDQEGHSFAIQIGSRGAPRSLLAALSPWITGSKPDASQRKEGKDNAFRFHHSFSTVLPPQDPRITSPTWADGAVTKESEEGIDVLPSSLSSPSSMRNETTFLPHTAYREGRHRLGHTADQCPATSTTGTPLPMGESSLYLPPAAAPQGVHLFDLYVRMTKQHHRNTRWRWWKRREGPPLTSSSVSSFFSAVGRPTLGSEVELYEVFIELEISPFCPSGAFSSSFSTASLFQDFIVTTWISFPFGIMHPFLQEFNLPPGAFPSSSAFAAYVKEKRRNDHRGDTTSFSSHFSPFSHQRVFSSSEATSPSTTSGDTFDSGVPVVPVSSSAGLTMKDKGNETTSSTRYYQHNTSNASGRNRISVPPSSSSSCASPSLCGKKRVWLRVCDIAPRSVPQEDADRLSLEDRPRAPSPPEHKDDAEKEDYRAGTKSPRRGVEYVLLEVSWETALVDSRVDEEERGMHGVILATTVHTEVLRTEGDPKYGSHEEHDAEILGREEKQENKKEGQRKEDGKSRSDEAHQRMDREKGMDMADTILPLHRPHAEDDTEPAFHNDRSNTIRILPTTVTNHSQDSAPRTTRSKTNEHRRRRTKQTIPLRIAAIPYIPTWPSTRHSPPSRYSNIRLPTPQAVILESRLLLPSYSRKTAEGMHPQWETNRTPLRGSTSQPDPLMGLPLAFLSLLPSPLLAFATNVCPFLQCREALEEEVERSSGSDTCHAGTMEDKWEKPHEDDNTFQNSDHSFDIPGLQHSSPLLSHCFRRVQFYHMDHEEFLLRLLSAGGVCDAVRRVLSLPLQANATRPPSSLSPTSTTDTSSCYPFPFSVAPTLLDQSPGYCAFSHSRSPAEYNLSFSTRRFRGQPMLVLHTFDEGYALKAPIWYSVVFFIALPILVLRILTHFFVL